MTGFNHFEARDYDAISGRFNNPDPARQFASGYNWVGNNPVRYTDPTGGVCEGCPTTSEYDYYHSSSTNYGYMESLGGNGTFQRMAELTITAQRPLVSESKDLSWIFAKGTLQRKITVGLQVGYEIGPVGLDINVASVRLASYQFNEEGVRSGNLFGLKPGNGKALLQIDPYLTVESELSAGVLFTGGRLENQINFNKSKSGLLYTVGETTAKYHGLSGKTGGYNFGNHKKLDPSHEFSVGAALGLGFELKFSVNE